MASVVLSGDTSGSVSLTVPAVAGTNTVTIPAETGTVLTTAVSGICRAWVNFNGTGTVAIRASFNVSSITDNAVGDYTINFTNAMSDANYSVSGITGATAASGVIRTPVTNGYTANSIRIENLNTSWGALDSAIINVSVFR